MNGRYLTTPNCILAGGFSEYRDEDAPVIYDIDEERMLLKKGTFA